MGSPRAAVKEEIARNFNRVASSYDRFAAPQRAALGPLLSRLETIRPSLVEGPILEIGCGTGLLSTGLQGLFPDRDLELGDLSPGMVAACRGRMLDAAGSTARLRWCVLDGERVEAEDHYALIVSGFTAQWFQDLETTMQRLARALRPGGWLICSYPGAGSYPEWREQCERLGLAWTANALPSWDRVRRALAGAPVAISCREQEEKERHASAREFFLGLKRIGAVTSTRGQSVGPGSLRRLIRAWDASRPDGVEVTCRIHYLSVQKAETSPTGSR